MNIRLSDPHHALACPQFLLIALTKTTQPTRFGMTSAIQPHDLITFEPVIKIVAAAAEGGFTVPVNCISTIVSEGTKVAPNHSGRALPVTGNLSSLQR